MRIQPAPSTAAAVLPSVQKPVQIPTAAELQLYQAAREPALLPRAPTASVAGLLQSTATQGPELQNQHLAQGH